MDSDLNKYDLESVCTDHVQMTRAEWAAIYEQAWQLYYSKEHMRTLLRRTAATDGPMASMVKLLLNFSLTVPLERVHPLQSGILRLRHPSELRPGLRPKYRLMFWPHFVWDTARKTVAILGALAALSLAAYKISRDPNRHNYMDQALSPVEDDGDLDLFTKTTGADAAIAHIKKVAELTGSGHAA